MIVCLCEAVNDRTIRKAIDNGSTTVRELTQACGAGRQCGSCCNDLRRMLESKELGPSSPGSSPTGILRR